MTKDFAEAAKFFEKGAMLGSAIAAYQYGCCLQDGIGVEQSYNEAAKWFNVSIAKGYVDAYSCLGQLYQDGLGVAQDLPGALNLYMKAADVGNGSAANMLGICFRDGIGHDRNVNSALAWFQKACERSCPNANYNLGMMYLKSDFMIQDYPKAVKYFQQGTELKSGPSAHQYAMCLLEGIGIAKSIPKAIEVFKLACEYNHPKAHYELGRMNSEGVVVPKNEVAAVKLYIKGADLGCPDAANALGCCFRDGIGTAKDDEAAAKWFRIACDKRQPHAFVNYGQMIENGIGVPQDPSEAARLYLNGAESKSMMAAFHYARCVHRGIGCAQNINEAAKWISDACKQKCPPAFKYIDSLFEVKRTFDEDMASVQLLQQLAERGNKLATKLLGFHLYDLNKSEFEAALSAFKTRCDNGHCDAFSGLGHLHLPKVKRYIHASRAFRMFSAGVRHGSAICMYNQGICHSLGCGCPKDPPQGLAMLFTACNLDDRESFVELGTLYFDGTRIKKNEAQGFKLLHQGAEAGSPRAAYNLGRCYREGYATPTSPVDAFKWFKQSANGFYKKGAYAYAACLRDGYGCEKDLTGAFEWFRHAVNLGHPEAQSAMHAVEKMKSKYKTPSTNLIPSGRIKISPASSQLQNIADFGDRVMDPRTLMERELLGQGATGVVKKMETHDGVQYAVKILNQHSTEKQFMSEVEAMAKIVHPCIVQIAAFFTPGPKQNGAIIMELVAGGTLGEMLTAIRAGQKNPFTDIQKTKIVLGIALGMRRVHAVGYVHRDLKPGNILLTSKLEPKIADFGIARPQTEATVTAVGTNRYMAPEQHGTHYTEKVDVFSFGLIAYEVFSGQESFGGIDNQLIPEMVRRGDRPPITPSCPHHELIQECWHDQPECRPSFQNIAQTLCLYDDRDEIFEYANRIQKFELQIAADNK